VEVGRKVPVNPKVVPTLSAEMTGEEKMKHCVLSMFIAHGVGVVIFLQLVFLPLTDMLTTKIDKIVILLARSIIQSGQTGQLY
jgi:hypothetical protein